MLLTACFLLLLSFPLAVTADWWDDFSNNFASDLAPLLSLFGEQVTKQFLSESIYFVDYIIFAMAPMGILTAVVSVIRTCGSPSLRAFIGRAQEGKGIAEAELCSSTSRDVCELYNNGGIARVFGRPKILEIIFDPEDADFHKEAGIYTIRNYLKTEKSVWVEQSGVSARSTTDVETNNPSKESANADSDIDLLAPNLSLNIGIKRQPTHVSWIVAGMGFFMQSGVMVFAGIATYYLKWEKDDKPPNGYSCPMMFAGTILLGIGTFYCALLIGQSTDEQVLMKRDSPKTKDKRSPIMFWVQPGGQVLGDQTFDPFCYSDDGKPLEQYIKSWKRPSVGSPFRVWEAIGVTMLGFVLQFTGLRGIHSAVSLAQIAVVLAMSMVRSLLRTQRLKLEDNKLAGFPDQVTGYELDWLALHIGEADIKQDLKQVLERGSDPPSLSSQSSPPSHRGWFSLSMWAERLLLPPRDSPPQIRYRKTRYSWKFLGSSSMKSIPRSELSSETENLDSAMKTFAYRARLGHLTMPRNKRSRIATSAASFHTEMVEVRQEAQRLAVAITTALNLLFPDGKENECLRWEPECSVSSRLLRDPSLFQDFEYIAEIGMFRMDNILDPWFMKRTKSKTCTIYLNLSCDPEDNQWKFDNNMGLESLLGLWAWSLMCEPEVEKKDGLSSLIQSRALEVPVRRIVSPVVVEAIKEWLPRNAFNFKEHTFGSSATQPEPGSLWEEVGGHYTPLQGRLKRDLMQQPVFRIFGGKIDGRSDSLKLERNSGTFKMFSVHTSGTLVSSCAHEVFASFLASVLHKVPEQENGGTETDNRGPRLRNLVDKAVMAFTDSQLGSAEEAMLCVLPPIVSRLDQVREGGP